MLATLRVCPSSQLKRRFQPSSRSLQRSSPSLARDSGRSRTAVARSSDQACGSGSWRTAAMCRCRSASLRPLNSTRWQFNCLDQRVPKTMIAGRLSWVASASGVPRRLRNVAMSYQLRTNVQYQRKSPTGSDRSKDCPSRPRSPRHLHLIQSWRNCCYESLRSEDRATSALTDYTNRRPYRLWHFLPLCWH